MSFSTELDMAAVSKLKYDPTTSGIASTDELNKIIEKLSKANVNKESLFLVAFDISRHCADVGTSEFSTLIGKSEHCDLVRSDLAAIIKSVTTLRRFCAYFSKFVWNHMITNNVAPANYLRKGYKEVNKFAAFDFFFAIQSSAAMEPPGGLIRKPTENEVSANKASGELSIYRQIALNGNNSLHLGEITQGKSGNNAICPIGKK
uniref:Capsid protein n=1 Tax=Saffron betaflexivirus 1 TaxID=3119434 RepID=A0AAU6MW41_9VIRU